jgi:hypothetical protein
VRQLIIESTGSTTRRSSLSALSALRRSAPIVVLVPGDDLDAEETRHRGVQVLLGKELHSRNRAILGGTVSCDTKALLILVARG